MGILNASEKKELKKIFDSKREIPSSFMNQIYDRMMNPFLKKGFKKFEKLDVGILRQDFYGYKVYNYWFVIIPGVQVKIRFDSIGNMRGWVYTPFNGPYKLTERIEPLTGEKEFNFSREYLSSEDYVESFENSLIKMDNYLKEVITKFLSVIQNYNLEEEANGASALQIKSNPENVVFCFGKIPRGFNLSNKPYNVYKGWHEDGKACMQRYGFKEPIILTDNINASGVVALSKRYPGKVMTYDEFLNGGKSLDTFESVAKQYSDAVRMNGKVVFKNKRYPNSYANLYEVGKDKVLMETCFDGNQKGLFKVKYMITDGEYTHNGVAKTWFYGRSGKPLVSVDEFGSVVDTLVKDAKQKAIFSQEDWNN